MLHVQEAIRLTSLTAHCVTAILRTTAAPYLHTELNTYTTSLSSRFWVLCEEVVLANCRQKDRHWLALCSFLSESEIVVAGEFQSQRQTLETRFNTL
ncbi:hypothetical protein ACOMHN_000302 [Nucella lapillus]